MAAIGVSACGSRYAIVPENAQRFLYEISLLCVAAGKRPKFCDVSPGSYQLLSFIPEDKYPIQAEPRVDEDMFIGAA